MLGKICQQEKHDFYWFFYAHEFVQKNSDWAEPLF